METLLYGDYKKRIKIKLFSDSESTLESIASLRQIVRKMLRMTVRDLMDCLQDKEIDSYQWLLTHEDTFVIPRCVKQDTMKNRK